MPRILLIEDDKYLNKLISDRLQLEGVEVTSALDGESAWKHLEIAFETEELFDHVVCDMLLPRIMGAELFTRLREDERFKNLTLTAISGVYKDPAQVDELKKLHGLHDYWTKPFAISDFVSFLLGRTSNSSESPLSGDLSIKAIERVFLDVYESGLTGRLTIKNNDLQRRLFFLNGFPVFSDSSSISESFGRSLVMMKLITPEQHSEVSREMVTVQVQYGQMLLRKGLVTEQQLYDALRKHTKRLLLNTFAIHEGSYFFEPLAELPSHIIPVEFNPILLLYRAQQGLFPGNVILSLFEMKMALYPKRPPRFFQILSLFNLDEKSLTFLMQLKGTEPLSSALSRIGNLDSEALLRVLFAMESLKLIEWVSEPWTGDETITPVDFRDAFQSDQAMAPEFASKIQAEYMALAGKNFFEVLGLTSEATDEEVAESYRSARYRLHPDRFGGSLTGESKRLLDDMMGKIDKAYQVLSEPKSRDDYRREIHRLASDSAADSKAFLQAQEKFRIGLDQLTAQKFDQAEATFLEAQKAWPRGIEYQVYAIFAQFRKAHKADDKSVVEQKLLKIKDLTVHHPDSDTAHLLLGYCYQSLNQLDLARKAYQKALEVNVQCEEAANALASIAKRDGAKEKIHAAVKKSSISKVALYTVIVSATIAAAFYVYYIEPRIRSEKEGVVDLDPLEYQGIFPKLYRVRHKADTAKIYMHPGWLQEVPDPVLEGKCMEFLKRAEPHGIMFLWIYEGEIGLKAQCRKGALHRY